MKTKTENIQAYTLTLEPKDINDLLSAHAHEALQILLKKHYIKRVNIPISCFESYRDSEVYKMISQCTDQKTTFKYYTVGKPQGSDKEGPFIYFTHSGY